MVDDNDDLRSFLVLFLRRHAGYDILEAATGEDAIEKAISGKPDVIVLDMTLPDMSGIGAIKELKNNPSTAEIPVIVYSGLPLLGWKQQALKAGSVAFLNKPVSLKLLMETIQKFILPDSKSVRGGDGRSLVGH